MKRFLKKVTPSRTEFKASLPGVDMALIKPRDMLGAIASRRQPVKVFVRFTWRF